MRPLYKWSQNMDMEKDDNKADYLRTVSTLKQDLKMMGATESLLVIAV